MARRQSTSKTRARRNRVLGSPLGRSDSSSGVLEPLGRAALRADGAGGGSLRFASIEQTIEAERGRLAQAESVLGCLRAALLYANENNQSDPDFAGAAGIALKLIQEAADLLDSARIRPLVDGGRKSPSTSRINKHETPRK